MTKQPAALSLNSLQRFGVLVIVCIVLFVGAVQYRAVMQQQQLALDRIGAQYQRLQALWLGRDDLARELQQLDVALERAAYAGSMSTERIHADMLQRFRQLADQHGVEVMGSQNLQLGDPQALVLVPMMVTLSADIAALTALLSDLSVERPWILIESMDIRSESRVVVATETQKLRVTLRLSAARRSQ